MPREMSSEVDDAPSDTDESIYTDLHELCSSLPLVVTQSQSNRTDQYSKCFEIYALQIHLI